MSEITNEGIHDTVKPAQPGPVGPVRLLIADCYTGFTAWRYWLPSRWQARLIFRANEADVVRLPNGSAWRRGPDGKIAPDAMPQTNM